MFLLMRTVAVKVPGHCSRLISLERHARESSSALDQEANISSLCIILDSVLYYLEK